MSENNVKATDASEPTRPQTWQEKWVGKSVDPETGTVTERRIVMNGQPFMATYGKDGKPTGYGYV